jgi:hypothetical protein
MGERKNKERENRATGRKKEGRMEKGSSGLGEDSRERRTTGGGVNLFVLSHVV